MSNPGTDINFALGNTAPIFKQVLGTDFERLPIAVRATHVTTDASHWRGQASVTRGRGVWAGFLGWLFGFPAASESVEVEVIKTRTTKGETWVRRFGPSRFKSRLAATPDGMTESFGLFSFLLGLRVDKNALHYPVRSGRFGPLPLPRVLLPISAAREYERDGRFHFDVKLHAPFTGGLLVHYQGDLKPVQAHPED